MHIVGYFVDSFSRLGLLLLPKIRVFQYSQHMDFLFVLAVCSFLSGEGFSPGEMFFWHDDVVQLIVHVLIFEQLFGLVKSGPFDVVVQGDFPLLKGSRDLKLLFDLPE